MTVQSTTSQATVDRDALHSIIPQASSNGFDPIPRPWRHPFRFIGWSANRIFGLVSMVFLLAVIAAVPIVNFLALGYLLEAEGRVARSGRLRDGFPLLEFAPRVGSIAIGISVWLVLVRLLADQAAVATQINPSGGTVLPIFKLFAMIFVTAQICFALAKGGRLRDFFPMKYAFFVAAPIGVIELLVTQKLQLGLAVLLIGFVLETIVRLIIGLVQFRKYLAADYLENSNHEIRRFIAGMRLKHHFSLGVRGFVGAFAWLFVPTALLAAASRTDVGEILVTIFGGFCLVLVFAWLPFLQARFAAENRLRAMFELRTIRRLFRFTPLLWLITVLVTYSLSLPLYLAKVQLPPADLIWLVTVIFVVSIYPTKLLSGWVYHRSRQKQVKRGQEKLPFVIPMVGRLAMFPALGFYVFMVFFTQAIDKFGKAALFEHHVFLLPAPFFLSGG